MSVKVADEVWIATALLTRENPERRTFRVKEIVARAGRERFTATLRPGVQVHASQHAVANKPPNPGSYRMLYATADGGRRLFRPGDYYHPNREGGKITPVPSQIPSEYHYLLQWYEAECVPTTDPVDPAKRQTRIAFQVDLAPEEAARLRERAARSGTQPETLAGEIVRAQLLADSNEDVGTRPVIDEDGVFHRERLEAINRYFEMTSAGLPSLPDEVLTREAMYQDHD